LFNAKQSGAPTGLFFFHQISRPKQPFSLIGVPRPAPTAFSA
jgi:hypothetical protein